MAGTSIWLKLKVVLWKNFIIRKHHWFLTLCEIVIPIVLFILIAYARAKVDSMGKKHVLDPTYNPVCSSRQFYTDKFNSETKILYSPETGFTTSLIDAVRLKLTLNIETVKGFASESDLVAYYEKFERNNTVIGIAFKNLGGSIPHQLKYILRPFEKYAHWDTQQLFNNFPQYIPEYGSVNYLHRGLIALKMALDTSFIEIASNKSLPYTILTMEEFPYPPYLNDMGISDMFSYVLPLVTLFSFLLLCPAVLKRVVEEKSTGIKELMRMMGLQSWMLWLGWFLHAFIVNCLSVLIIIFFMKVALWDAQYPPIQYCDGSLLFVFLILYCAASITFCFVISSLFNRPTLAMVFGLLSWMLSYSIPTGILDHAPSMDWSPKILFGIFPNMALAFGYEAISIYESREVGASWSNIFQSASGGRNDITMGNVFMMFLFEIVLFLLITVYIESIHPGPYGLAKPFHFPVSFIWKRIIRTNTKVQDEETSTLKDYCKIENAPDLKTGIRIKNLYKKFGKELAVNDLSIDIYEGQITALLGHNGAGKTTTMSIITGMIAATSGSVLINDLDIKQNMNKVRSSLGLCPQHNLQFTDLTVIEHLMFFGMLKGLSRANAEREANELLDRMNLSCKRTSLASSLSGGMRRKLSLGIALIGNAKVLILDEPTSGLDPEARREIWDMLLSLRGSRTIIITTHFMEEADVLGDRIAIMDHGRLICYGTSMFLKKEYGTGYHLTIIRDKGERIYDNQVDNITKTICDQIRSAVLQSSTGNQLTYLLPHETKSQFSELLVKLESVKEELGITNIGMSVTTLEEVFLKVGNLVSKEDHKDVSNDTNSLNSECENSVTSVTSNSRCTGSKLLKLQLWGLLSKRWWVLKSKCLIFFIQVLLAVSTTILTLYLGEAAGEQSTENFKEFDFNLNKYGETSVVYGGTGLTDPDLKNMQNYYKSQAAAQQGHLEQATDKSVSDVIIKMGIDNIAYYKQHMIVAAEFNITGKEKIINAMYSNKALHGAPISLNLLMNAVLKSVMGDGYSISSGNLPLPVISENGFEQESEIQVAILWFMLFPLGMLFLAGTFLLFPLMERVSNIKQLQLMCGIRSVYYWLMCYAFDLALYISAIVILLLAIIIYGCFGTQTFSGSNEIFALLQILIIYGVCVIPYSYLFSYKKTAAGGFSSFLISSMFVSDVMTIGVIILESSGDDYYINIGRTLKYIFLCFPQFGLTYSVVQFSRKTVWNHNWNIKPSHEKAARCHYERNPCCDGATTPECKDYQSYFSGDTNLTNNLIIMGCSTFIYFMIILILETTFITRARDKLYVFMYNRIFHRKKDDTDGLIRSDKADVQDETKRVFSTLEREKKSQKCEENDLLLVHKLEKIYWNNKAVNGVSFGVKPGDCFGLLGVNGAGKTTTFRMLTGDEPLMSGDARISEPLSQNKIHISKDSKEYLAKVGYCPQFDAINEVLTGREMLQLFAHLRGIYENVDKEVNMWLKVLGLEDYADKPCGDYSGGNKRKLSMAVALIGGPLLVMLDEPTSGVDPVSRRKLWDTLTALQRQEDKPSFLLTSHSMEECEALCNKLAIMKAGQLECYGTIPKLKQKYGQGFTIMLKLKPALLTVTVNPLTGLDDIASTTSSQSHPLTNDNHSINATKKQKCIITKEVTTTSVLDGEEVTKLCSDFESKYAGFCTLRDKHSGLLHYHISDKNKRWGDLFKEIESLKVNHPIIEDYNISETTLEEVFLSIARSEK